ncbi:hypothetical protein JOB18_001654 [Solea senegalensis]|uniref:Myb/SANT-like DNA-binding domain-containing protein n=1 Tax=Solea senegalensis TaxID=28829 RepID=A0AAV6SXZ9_SOLSE|nr:uncharacterized protein LOC122775799 isoform X1 [Solea senegalensis]KAG7521581.1 hypothetical protein JOB18_001654 [Solea senegalensis]
MANTYRMTDEDIRLMIQLRASNAAVFTGRKNSALIGWRAISKELGLEGLVSAQQLKKKWGNMKEKYKLLKYPPAGMENVTKPTSWRWFHLMEQAECGHLAEDTRIIPTCHMEEDEELGGALLPLSSSNMEEDISALGVIDTGSLESEDGLMEITDVRTLNTAESPTEVVTDIGVQVCVKSPERKIKSTTLLPHTDTVKPLLLPPLSPSSSSRHVELESAELDRKLSELQRERQVLEREQAEFDRELIALERDRELLNRDMVTVQRERTAVDRDRAAVERDRALLERDRAFLDRDRAVLERDKVFLERAREDLERERTLLKREKEAAAVDGGQAETVTDKEVLLQTKFCESLRATDLDPDQLETRQRLVSLFQKLVEKL